MVRCTEALGRLWWALDLGHRDRYWDFRSIGRGTIDSKEIVRALNRVGFAGTLSIEWEDRGMDSEFGAREGCAIKATNFPPLQVALHAAFAQE